MQKLDSQRGILVRLPVHCLLAQIHSFSIRDSGAEPVRISFVVNRMLNFVNRGCWGSVAGRRSFSPCLWWVPPMSPAVCVSARVRVHVFSASPSGWPHRAPSCGQLPRKGLLGALVLSGWLLQAARLQHPCRRVHVEGTFPQHMSVGISLMGCCWPGTSSWTTCPTPFRWLFGSSWVWLLSEDSFA